MKILLVYDCIYPESLGGVEYRNHCLARALAERGHEVTVAGWISDRPAPENGVAILPMSFRTPIHDGTGERSTSAALKFAAAAARIDICSFDVIETATVPYLHILPLALRCALAGKPLVITWYEFFGRYWQQYKNPLVAPAYQAMEWLCAQIGRVNATSQLTARRVERARFYGRKNSVPVLPCGVWIREIEAAAQRAAADGPPLLYAGRLIPEKRVDLILRAVAEMNATEVGTEAPILGICGSGPERARLEELAVQLGIVPLVKFYGRLPEIEDMWRLLAGARVAIQPSIREGFGLFPLEAMALGRPVVYCRSAYTAVADIVRDGIEGVCVTPAPKDLAGALTQLLGDKVYWHRLSEACLRRALSYDWPAVAEQCEAFCSKLINGQRPTKGY